MTVAMQACSVLVMQVVNTNGWELSHINIVEVVDTRN